MNSSRTLHEGYTGVKKFERIRIFCSKVCRQIIRSVALIFGTIVNLMTSLILDSALA